MFDSFGGAGNGVSGASANIDLLNLDRRFKSAGKIDVNENRVIEVDAIEVNWVVNFIEHADDHELLAIVTEGLSDGFSATK